MSTTHQRYRQTDRQTDNLRWHYRALHYKCIGRWKIPSCLQHTSTAADLAQSTKRRLKFSKAAWQRLWFVCARALLTRWSLCNV